MRYFATGIALAAAVVTLAGASVIAQQNPGGQVGIDPVFRSPRLPAGRMVKPPINKLVGTWKLNLEASRFENTAPPADATRTYRDLGNGTYEYTQISVAPEGTRSETQYVGKDDGTETHLMRVGTDNKPMDTGVTLAFRWVNNFLAEQVQIDHGVVATLKRELSPDGKTMTITYPTNSYYYIHQHADDPIPDIVIFDKQ